MSLSVAYITRPCVGHTANGDAVVVRHEGDTRMFAVVDALGHGEHAAVVSRAAVEYLDSADVAADVETIVRGMSKALKGSRGAQGMVCTLRGRSLHGCGVGNVDLRVHGSRVPVVLTPGILGASVRRYRVFHADLAAGDRMVMFSDGISMRIPLAELSHLSAQDACDHVFELHRRSHDDASILIVDVQA